MSMKKILKHLNWLDKHSDRIWTITLAGDGSGSLQYDGVEVAVFANMKSCKRMLKRLRKPAYKILQDEVKMELE